MGVRDNKSPFSYFISSDDSSSHNTRKFVGYSIDICYYVVKYIKEELDLDYLNVGFKVVTNENRFELLLKEAYDLECGTTTNTEQR